MKQDTDMNNTFAPFLESSKANLQALENIVSQTFAGVEQLVVLNFSTSKSVWAESLAHAKAMLDAKDAQELMALQSGFMKPSTEKYTAYAEQVTHIIKDSGADLKNMVESTMAEAQKKFSNMIDGLDQNAPPGLGAIVLACKSAMTASQNAIETAQAQAKEAIETMRSNLTGASNDVIDIKPKASRNSKA